jgi:hypothetical protein
MNGGRRRTAAAVLALSLMAVSGCAGPAGSSLQSSSAPTHPGPKAPLSPDDANALAQLAEVAPRTSTIDPDLADWTECWLPSAHVIPAKEVGNATTWKVICRIHWHEADSTSRYQDTTCIGDFAKEPMLDHCYRWVHYDYEPEFDDHPGVPA